VERRKCFRLKYPRLYSICNDKAALVGEVGTFSGRDTDWSFHWRRHLFMWEEELLLSLKEDLEGMVWSQAEDVWRWNLDDMGMFSVKSAYDKLEGLALSEVRWRVEDKRVFQDLWKTPALSKVSALVWRVLLNRIPTKDNLALRNVLPPEESTMCVMCASAEESSLHLLLHCYVASSVWLRLMSWLDAYFITPPNLFIHWKCWVGGNKNIKKGRWFIWLSTIWVLWKVRNDKIFNGRNFEVDEIVEVIKVLSWRWFLSRTKIPVCLFYEWILNPILCLGREGRR